MSNTMATLRTRIKGEPVSVEITIEELHRLLELQHATILRGLATSSRRARASAEESSKAESEAVPTTSLIELVRRAWPEGMDLVEDPDLTTGNVRRFLIQRILSGAPSVSTAEVCTRFFGRELLPTDPRDAVNLRRVWYSIREAKRDIEEALGGGWQDATDAPVRAGTFRSWKYVPDSRAELKPDTFAYREGPA